MAEVGNKKKSRVVTADQLNDAKRNLEVAAEDFLKAKADMQSFKEAYLSLLKRAGSQTVKAHEIACLEKNVIT